MSIEAPAWFVEQYKSSVKHVFQSQGFKLKPTVLPEGRVEGATVHWPVFGTFEMQESDGADETPPANPQMGDVSATMKDYDALYEIKKKDLTKMTANEQQAATAAGGKAVGRRVDKIIMNALNDAAVANSSIQLGGASAVFDLEAALMACDSLQDDDQIEWDGDVTAVIPVRWFNRLMMYKEFNSSEWVGADLGFPSGVRGKNWNGVKWLPLSKKEMLIPGANQAYGFMYHRTAAGYYSNYEGEVNIQWDNRKGVWTVRFDLQAVAKAIFNDAKGIRRLHYLTNTAIERPVQRTQTVS